MTNEHWPAYVATTEVPPDEIPDDEEITFPDVITPDELDAMNNCSAREAARQLIVLADVAIRMGSVTFKTEETYSVEAYMAAQNHLAKFGWRLEWAGPTTYDLSRLTKEPTDAQG